VALSLPVGPQNGCGVAGGAGERARFAGIKKAHNIYYVKFRMSGRAARQHVAGGASAEIVLSAPNRGRNVASLRRVNGSKKPAKMNGS